MRRFRLRSPGRQFAVLRTLGAIAVLVVGGVHLQQYFADYFRWYRSSARSSCSTSSARR